MDVVKKKRTMKDEGTARRTSKRNARKEMSHRPRRTHPDATKIKASRDVTYADILRRVKTTPNFVAVGEQLTRIRHTITDKLLLEFGKSGRNTLVLT